MNKQRKCRKCKALYDTNGSTVCDICKTRCHVCGEKLTRDTMHEKDIENRVFKHKGCVPSVDFSTKSSQSRKDYTLRRTYGITESEFMLLKESQEHQCAICGKVTAATLHVDHQHTVGEKAILKEKGHAIIRKNVRGLLCMACNRGLAAFRDNAELFEKAAIYLKNWPAKKIIKR